MTIALLMAGSGASGAEPFPLDWDDPTFSAVTASGPVTLTLPSRVVGIARIADRPALDKHRGTG